MNNANRPETKDELISFMCMAHSNADFIPYIAKRTPTLWDLTKKYARFTWSTMVEQEFQDLKNALKEDTTLRYYDTKLPTFIVVDAHINGLCAILCQGTEEDLKIVKIASRTTTATEKHYPQIDLEGLSVDYGLRHFRQYALGNKVTVLTDHQPLEALFANTRKASV